MVNFYYQIKGKAGHTDPDYISMYGNPQNWTFPPIFSGMVEAETREDAKKIINELYDKKFPLRVLSKDLESNEFLLSIEEMKKDSHRFKLFEKIDCSLCGNSFYMIDRYNDHNEFYKGWKYCSDRCKDEHYMIRESEYLDNRDLDGLHVPVIYKITNKNTGKCYIGKTTQPFTLRWYQHFYQQKGTKFHDEISKSKLSDWVFEIQEEVEFPTNANFAGKTDRDRFILERERFWITQYNSINEGYNSI
jgi:hypothetical protein